MRFKLEGNVCFAKVPPGFEIRYEIYDLYPDGSKNMAITVRPMPPESVNPDAEALIYVYTSCDCVIGVYPSREQTEKEGRFAAMERFGVEGSIEEFRMSA